MSKQRLSNRDLSHFNIIDVKSFLEFENWTLQDETSKALFFTGPKSDSGKPLEIILPKSEKNIDYFERINDFIFLMSDVKGIDVKEVINQISLITHDILKMRVVNPGNFLFSIPLDVAAKEIDALKRLFIYGACSEEKARPFYEKPTTIGINHGNQCQFGHTFEGSFGFTINSPICSDCSQLSLFKEHKNIPFERKVMERIVNGFMITEEATISNNSSLIVENFETGFNSKMCEALIDISMEKTKTIEFSVNWSSQIELPSDVRNFKSITLTENYYDTLKEASEELKKVEPFHEFIIGKIITLHSNKNPFSDEEFPRTAIIKHTYEGHSIDVKLELDKEKYKIVYDAHGEGKTVKVNGNLFKKGAIWRMIDIISIELLYQ